MDPDPRTRTAPTSHALADVDAQRALIARLHRAEGQLRGVAGMIEDGRGCADVVIQLAAVGRAVDRIALALVTANLRECIAHGEVDVESLADDLDALLRPLS
jgi:DNA-binding FrmR family transcriptional regulator